MCLICFLKDKYQFNLRRSSMLRSDRIEHTLDRYKYAFADDFKESLNSLCESHTNDTCKKIANTLKGIHIKDIFEFFDTLRKAYIDWINTQISVSIKTLNCLLDLYGLLNINNQLEAEVFYRGRKSTEFLSHRDIFHIPFNKRYLIENQRYSLTGQPLLYLSSSPYGVVRELGTSESVKISSFRLAKDVSLKVYENMNKFSRTSLENQNNSKMAFVDFMLNNTIFSDEKLIIQAFFQMILASCCSFERREETKKSFFSEEYVLPQILTLVLKQHGYHGVRYTSTKAHKDNDIIDSERAVRLFYSNTCLFTNYTEKQSKDVNNMYDEILFKKFITSNLHNYCEDIPEAISSVEESINITDEVLNSDFIGEYENQVLVNIGTTLLDISDFLKTLITKKDKKAKELLKAISLHSFLLKNVILNIKEIKYKNVKGDIRCE
jgi:ribosomal protein S17E